MKITNFSSIFKGEPSTVWKNISFLLKLVPLTGCKVTGNLLISLKLLILLENIKFLHGMLYRSVYLHENWSNQSDLLLVCKRDASEVMTEIFQSLQQRSLPTDVFT